MIWSVEDLILFELVWIIMIMVFIVGYGDFVLEIVIGCISIIVIMFVGVIILLILIVSDFIEYCFYCCECIFIGRWRYKMNEYIVIINIL